jgi:hypothetical protein
MKHKFNIPKIPVVQVTSIGHVDRTCVSEGQPSLAAGLSAISDSVHFSTGLHGRTSANELISQKHFPNSNAYQEAIEGERFMAGWEMG